MSSVRCFFAIRDAVGILSGYCAFLMPAFWLCISLLAKNYEKSLKKHVTRSKLFRSVETEVQLQL